MTRGITIKIMKFLRSRSGRAFYTGDMPCKHRQGVYPTGACTFMTSRKRMQSENSPGWLRGQNQDNLLVRNAVINLQT